MATAVLTQAAFARTAIVHSVCRVSVSGTFVPNKLVESVKTESHVKLECPAKIVLVFHLTATSMPDKAAKAYLTGPAGLSHVFRMAFALPAYMNLAPKPPVLRSIGPLNVQPWQLGVITVVVTKRVYLLMGTNAFKITNALLATVLLAHTKSSLAASMVVLLSALH
jgi:hypothetical protein